jgi:hypothetical protein
MTTTMEYTKYPMITYVALNVYYRWLIRTDHFDIQI